MDTLHVDSLANNYGMGIKIDVDGHLRLWCLGERRAAWEEEKTLSNTEDSRKETQGIAAAMLAQPANESKGEFKPTPTARSIVAFLSEHEGEPVTKAAIAAELGRCEKTIDRLAAKLRDHGYIAVEEHWNDNGAQLANTYRVLREG